jgi:flagellin FlaB
MSSKDQNDAGFTGLEAAIVLIAFVVVAAVFSYVVLGAGFFTTQKAQQTVYSAVGQSSSTLELIGNVYGLNTSATTPSTPMEVDTVNFTLGLAAGATAVDMSKTTMVYSDANSLIPLAGPSGTTAWTALPTNLPTGTNAQWAITADQNSPTGKFTGSLNPNEQYTITVYIPTGIPANDKFNIQISPSIGASISLTRTVPGTVTAVNLLY